MASTNKENESKGAQSNMEIVLTCRGARFSDTNSNMALKQTNSQVFSSVFLQYLSYRNNVCLWNFKKYKCMRKERGLFSPFSYLFGFPCGSDGKSICLQCRKPGFDPWVGKIPWRRKWQPTPVLLPGKSHGQRTLVGYSPWDHKESDMTEWLHFLFLSFIVSTETGD